MTKQNIVIATITLARDEEEETLLRQSLLELAKLNLPVFITDGGSRGEFLAFLRNFPQFHLSATYARGVWQQAKSSLWDAYHSGADFIVYTEPDKTEFFSRFLEKMLEEVEMDKTIGVALASRSAAGFSSFPTFQQMTETAINKCCFEITGILADHTYGPFIMNRKLIPYINLVKEDIGWGWRPYIFGIASRLNCNVISYKGDFSCPPSQQDDSAPERIYRMKQLGQNMQGIVLSTQVVL